MRLGLNQNTTNHPHKGFSQGMLMITNQQHNKQMQQQEDKEEE
jgi:hypothetical protein